MLNRQAQRVNFLIPGGNEGLKKFYSGVYPYTFAHNGHGQNIVVFSTPDPSDESDDASDNDEKEYWTKIRKRYKYDRNYDGDDSMSSYDDDEEDEEEFWTTFDKLQKRYKHKHKYDEDEDSEIETIFGKVKKRDIESMSNDANDDDDDRESVTDHESDSETSSGNDSDAEFYKQW